MIMVMDAYLVAQDVVLPHGEERRVKIPVRIGGIFSVAATDMTVVVNGVELRWLTGIMPGLIGDMSLLLTPPGFHLHDSVPPVGRGTVEDIFNNQLKFKPADVANHRRPKGFVRGHLPCLTEQVEPTDIAPPGDFRLTGASVYLLVPTLTVQPPSTFLGRWLLGETSYSLHQVPLGFIVSHISPALRRCPGAHLLISTHHLPGLGRLDETVNNMSELINRLSFQ